MRRRPASASRASGQAGGVCRAHYNELGRGTPGADTSLPFDRLQIEAWRRMSALVRLHAADALSREFQALLLAAIRNRRPDASERECFLRLAVIELGRERAVQLYPDAADL